MTDEIICPNCKAQQEFIEFERSSEYVGGGYQDYWYECYCTKCEWEWRTESKTDYM